MPHDSSPVDGMDLSEVRWKMLVACDTCRRRKVRCDGRRPCSKCNKRGKACTFATPRRVLPHPKPQTPDTSRPESFTSNATSLESASASSTDEIRAEIEEVQEYKLEASDLSKTSKEHLLLIDSDDQIVYSGPSTDMPLFARLGLLHTIEVSESDHPHTDFPSHMGDALGITGAATSSGDYFDLCLQHCPLELMNSLIHLHLTKPVFFPLLHPPSFLAEFTAITQRRLPCTAQYSAMLMSILAVTVRLVERATVLLPESQRNQTGESYFRLAQKLLRFSKNNLDIRYLLALYHMALFAEGRNEPAGSESSFIAEAVGLAFTTGLHRSTLEFNMDPVTLQIRTRLFWALYILDTTFAYNQGRPPLIRLSECSIVLPIAVDNEYIKKSEILPQPEDKPPLAIAAAIKMIEVYMILEQVLSAINAPTRTLADAYNLHGSRANRSELMRRARSRLDEIEQQLPSYLSPAGVTPSAAPQYLFPCRLRAVFLFVKTLIARQALVEELDSGVEPARAQTTLATLEACRLSVDTVKTYSRLRHHGLLYSCGSHAVSHVTAAAHTLIACMLRSSDLALEHRPDLLTAIDILLVLSSVYSRAETVGQLLAQLSRNLDHGTGPNTKSETVAIRVLARRMARSPPVDQPQWTTPAPTWDEGHHQEVVTNQLCTGFARSESDPIAATPGLYGRTPASLPSQPDEPPKVNGTGFSDPSWSPSNAWGALDSQWIPGSTDHQMWEDSFSFLNDGLFSKL